MKICVIPARKGSKRLPKKNLKLFRGKPLVEIAMDLALSTNLFDLVVVNSDDEQVLEMANTKKAVLPSFRPQELSGDEVRADEVIRWQICKLDIHATDIVCCLLPTTPGLTVEELSNGYLEYSKDLDSPLFGVTPMIQTPFRSFALGESGGLLTSLFPEKLLQQSQDYPQMYIDAGQFYFARAKTWQETFSITSHNRARGIILSPEMHPDINTLSDWEYFIMNSNRDRNIGECQ